MDVRVEVRPAGFEQLWVVRDEAGLAELIDRNGTADEVVLTGDMTVAGSKADPQADGSVDFVDSKGVDKGKQAGELRVPAMWDGEVDPGSGEPLSQVPVEFTVSADGDVLTPEDPAQTGELSLAVSADREWLEDADRVFPITIDPTYAAVSAGATFDTFVQEGYTTDQSGDDELKLGNNGAGDVARSYLNFSASALLGKTIMSASLALYETWSWNCTARGWSAYNAGTASTSSRWTSQPTISTKYATSTQTTGYNSSCADGTVSIDMKAQLQSWANDTTTSRGLLLRADSESDPSYWKRFQSKEAAHPPVLKWTYNRTPATPALPTMAPAVMFTPGWATTPRPYTASTTPSVSAVVSDPDGNTVRGEFYVFTTEAATSGHISSCLSGYVASGSTATCTLSPALPADGVFFLKARANDAKVYGALSPAQGIRVASVTPPAPVISCPSPYSHASWTTAPPAANLTCKISATAPSGYSTPSKIHYSVDGAAYTDVTIYQSSDPNVAFINVTVSKNQGGHNIRATAISPVGKSSTQTTYTLGYGSASLVSPKASPRVTTVDRVAVEASGPPKGVSAAPTARTEWRVSGATGTAGWVTVPTGNSLSVSEVAGQTKAVGVFDTTSIVGLADGSSISVNGRVSTLVDVRVCIVYTSGTQCTGHSTVLRVPHAFGSGFPVADAGPGQVALWTGELSLSSSDATLSTPDGGLSVSRSHTSFAGPPAAVQNGVFGPGWTASFDGDSSGMGGAEIWDSTTVDGTLAVADSDGGVLVYSTPTGARRTTATIPTGTYQPVDDDTETSGTKLVVSGSGAATIASVTSDDGTITRFQVTAAPTTAAADFRTVDVTEPAVPGKTSYSYDSAGRVTSIVGALPDGVTACTVGTAANGCRTLRIVYAATTTATTTTSGDYTGQVKQIFADVNTDSPRELAAYKYDDTGRLLQAKDSRPNLTTGYTWTGTGTTLRLATLTPPGLAAFTFSYDSNKLKSVTRPNPTTAGGGTAQLAAYIYGVPTSGTWLPDVTANVVQDPDTGWDQASVATSGFAVFGPDKVVTGITPAAVTAPADWAYADLQYTDALGYTLNTASYGAGDWQYTAADYDPYDNIIRSFDQRAIAAIRTGTIPGGGEASDAATLTVYNNDISAGGAVVTPAGTFVTDTYGPVRETTPAGGDAEDGTLLLRAHTKTLYDQDAPNSGINPDTTLPYRLATTTTLTAEQTDGTIDSTLSRTLTGYDALTSGDPTGWELGQPTSTTVDMDLDATVSAGDITIKTRYDARGRTIEDRQPRSDGSDSGTRTTTYYTAGSSPVSGCGSKPQYAGRVCQVGPAAQPAGQTLPVTTTTSYTWDGQGATEEDVSGTVTSTTTSSYDTSDRPTSTATTVTGLSSSEPVPALTSSYDPAIGLSTGTTSTAGSTATGYDSWGRAVTYTNTVGGTSDTATTTYDPLGRVTSTVDGNGATSYGYDGTDAAGDTERRGLVTQTSVKVTGGADYVSTGAYDPAGALVLERLPGQINRRSTIDLTGDLTESTYHGRALNPDTELLEADQPWLGWSQTSDAASRTIREWTPDGAAGYTGQLGATATATDRHYTYENAGRLIKTEDQTGAAAGGDVSCTTRSYRFDRNGNRTDQNSSPADTDGSCTTTGGIPITRHYDTADRPTTGANSTGTYTYDPLGRQTKIPAVDTPQPDAGDLTLGYYDSDAAHTITQGTLGSGGTRTSLALDGSRRRHTETTETDAGTSTLVRHYTDTSDNPAWTVDTTNSTNTTTRYAETITGDLGLTLTTTGSSGTIAQLALATPRGDTATTITLPTNATSPTGIPAGGIDTWTSYTEYGQPQQAVDNTPGGITGIGYGWLGTKQRGTIRSRLTLLGRRLYNAQTSVFSSVDPRFGGNPTAYSYTGDPVNLTDISGCGRFKRYFPRCWRAWLGLATWIIASQGVCGAFMIWNIWAGVVCSVIRIGTTGMLRINRVCNR